jgi:hypothetical protein
MEEVFEINYQLAILQVVRKGSSKFHIHFSNEVPAVVISKVTGADGKMRWKMEQPGNDELAEGIGHLLT